MNKKLICIDKLRNKYNKIYSYVLVDNNNSVVSLSPDELKTHVKRYIKHVRILWCDRT